ncbi:hypothetical protein HAP32_01906 [Serratia fonticola]|jgi:hypothetical protein|nr:hypothetical protein HAP32_01906 [Serratia fonticola]
MAELQPLEAFNKVTLLPITCRIVKALKFNFLLRGDENFNKKREILFAKKIKNIQ